ncbi:MAG: hypothetical protein ACI4Q3_00780 [Kiritimatiellia bacterium]
MEKLKAYLKRPSTVAFLVFSAAYALCMAFIFWGTWSLDRAPVGPDNPTFYPVDEAARWFKGVCAGGKFVPGDLKHVLGGMYFWQELQYAFAGWMAALGVAFHLRGRGLSPVAAYGGGAAFGLMGYAFTLFAAGHLGWFMWMTYGTFAFGLTDRCVRKGRWRNWALLGAVLAWASAYQSDLWLLFTLFTAAYGVWCLVRERSTIVWPRLLAGVGLCLLTALAVGLPQFRYAVLYDLKGREEQIAASSSRTETAETEGEASAETRRKKAQERWLFCTSWSLPPEDTLEFFIPEIHGGSNDPRVYRKPGNAPYKGRLGQHGVVPEGQGGRHPVTGELLKAGDEFWMPYRQHGLYFGLITLALAFVGVVGRFRKDRDVRFWTVAALVVYLCALGGFTPFYRLVYLLPFGDVMRCPVKFVHLLELCAAVLAGYGIETLRRRSGGTRGWIVPALALVALVNVADLARVDAKYLAVQDVAFHRAPNEAAADVVRQGGGSVAVAVAPQEGGTLIRESFGTYLVDCVDYPSQAARFVLANGTALRNDAALNARLKDGSLKSVGTYVLSQKGGIRRSPQAAAALALFQVADAPPPEPKADPVAPPGVRLLTLLSVLSTFGILVWGLVPVLRRRR